MPGTLTPIEAFELIDVLVHTSVQPEPFGRVIVEAMIARRPVVAFRHGGPLEVLNDTTGTLANSMDGAGAGGRDSERGRRPCAGSQSHGRRRIVAARTFFPEMVAAKMDRAYSKVRR